MAYGENKIQTTHVGSLPRPHDVLDMMKAHLTGETTDEAAYNARLAEAVTEIVQQQVENGLDIVGDGEVPKAGFFAYVRERLEGFEARPDVKVPFYQAEVDAFPEYYKEYFERAMMGGSVAPVAPFFCTGPITYTGEEILKRDLENLKAACDKVGGVRAFVPSIAPSGVGRNDYYKTDEEFYNAVGEAMRTEYLAIIEAGFDLQIDDPYLSDNFGESDMDQAQKVRRADIFIEALNNALRGIPPERVRYHTCYGINEGPRIHEASLRDVIEHVLRVEASVFSFEAANPRHEHDYHVFEDYKLKDGQAIMPGVITHASNIVEHPELIAEWLVRFADLVGRDNVIAGADCGFSSQACYHTEVHPTVIWAKFQAMNEGAALASKKLWG